MNTQTHLRKLMVAFAAILTLVFLSSCSKDNDTELNGKSKIQVIHSAQGTGAVDLYVGDVKLNSSAVAYTQSSGYIETTTGAKTAQIKLAENAQVLSSTNVNFEEGKNYTIYVTSSGSSNNSVVTKDETSAPSAGQAKVRLVNLSSFISSAAVTLDNTSSLSNNLAFGAATDYSAVSSGAHNFKVVSTTNATATSNATFTLQQGKVYTIYITGTTSLGLNIVTNN